MRKLTVVAIVCAILGVVLWLVAATRSTATKEKIAFIVPTLGNPFFVDMTSAAKAAAGNDPNVELRVQAAPEFTSVEQEIALIEDAVTAKVAAICLVAADSKGVVPSLRKAQDAGIPVVLVDNTLDPAAARQAGLKPIGHIGSDNLLGGKLAAEFIGRSLHGQGEVAMLEGVLGSDVANARKDGFLAALAGFPGLRLVTSQTANYSRAQALDVFQNILQAHPQLNGLFAANDEMALGAIKAAGATATPTKLVIVGFDATADGLAAVHNGTLAATIQQDPKEMGRRAVALALQLIHGKDVPPDTQVPVKLITKEGE